MQKISLLSLMPMSRNRMFLAEMVPKGLVAVKLIFFLVLVLKADLVFSSDLHVGSSQKHATIQAAVNAASSGDTIYIHAGTYKENVQIHNFVGPLTIIPYGGDLVTVDPMNDARPTFWIHGSTSKIYVNGKGQMTIIYPSNVGDKESCMRISRDRGVIDQIEIREIIFSGTFNKRGAAITLVNEERVLIEHCTFGGTYYYGVDGQSGKSQGPPSQGTYRLTVKDCTFIDPDYAGVNQNDHDYWLIEKNCFCRTKPGGQFLLVQRGGNNWRVQYNRFELLSGTLNGMICLRDNTGYGGQIISNDLFIKNTFAILGGSFTTTHAVVFLGWGKVRNVKFLQNVFYGNFAIKIFKGGNGYQGGNNIASDNLKTASDYETSWGTPEGWNFTDNTESADVNIGGSTSKLCCPN